MSLYQILDAVEGEILGIIGVNGAGKTTLLRTLAGLSEPKSGTIILEGRKSSSKFRRKRFGMVMQDVQSIGQGYTAS